MNAAELAEQSKLARLRAAEVKAQTVAAAQRLLAQADADFSAAERAIDAEHRAELARRESDLAVAYHPRLVALLASYFEVGASRAVARDLAATIVELDVVAREQIGQPPGAEMIAAAGMAAVERFDRVGLDGSSRVISASGAARRAAMNGAIVDLERALEALERELMQLRDGSEAERRLHTLLAAHCLATGTFSVKRAAFDAAHQAERLATHTRDYRPPAMRPSRAYNALNVPNPHYGRAAADAAAMRLAEAERDAQDRRAVYGDGGRT